MAEERNPDVVISSYPVGEAGDAEARDRGLFGFMGKKEDEKVEEEVLVTGVEKVHIEETEKPVEEEKKHGLLEKLHRSHSSSSSSSSDEEGEGEGEKKEKKKKKKKGLKEKIKEKLHGDEEKMEEKPEVVVVAEEDTTVVVEKVEAHPEDEKKGFLDRIKEKLPGHNKKPTEEGATATAPPPPPPPAVVECGEHHAKEQEGEKKGFLEKIKEKLPGFHKNGGEEGEKTAAGH